MTWFDTHFHLDERHPEFVTGILTNARAAGVTRFLLQSTTPRDCSFVLKVAKAEDDVWGAIGQHPLDVGDFTSLEDFLPYYSEPKVVAVGEIGLDYHYTPETAERQKEVLALFLQIAVEKKLPAIIHCRDAFEDCYALVCRYCPAGFPVVIHSFTGTPQQAALWLERGSYLSVNGMVTFKNAENIREALKVIPMERLLLETDSPYLAPVPLRGTENTPANIPIIGAKVAELRGLTPEQVCHITTENALRLFALP